jgi:hypothetical protein
MITQCDKCKKKQDVPDVYRSRQIKCQHCKESIIANECVALPEIPKPDPVQATIEIIKKRNPIRSAWNRMPTPFKTAFLSTFGVMSALLITYYVYGSPLWTSTPKSVLMSFEEAKAILAKGGLFGDGDLPERRILRGRALMSSKYVPDANKFFPSLYLWTDENSHIAGISAFWCGDYSGWPAGLKVDTFNSYFLNRAVVDSFHDLTGFNILRIPSMDFSKEGKRESAYETVGIWSIVVERIPSLQEGSPEHISRQKTKNQDVRVYDYSITAQSW